MSREAFSLFHGFNPKNNSFYSIKEAIVAKKPTVTGPMFMEEATREEKDLVKKVYESFPGTKEKAVSEIEMTKGMAAKLMAISRSGDFIAEPELALDNGGDRRSHPQIDIAFGKEDADGAGGKTLTGFSEVGCLLAKINRSAEAIKLDSLFWHKIDQMLNYLQYLLDPTIQPKELTLETKSALLLCVIVTNRTWLLGRLAVFVSEPRKHDNKWRIAMLWRKELHLLQEISDAFGGYVNSLRYFTQLDESHSLQLGEEWLYMGPNCAKVTLRDETWDEVCLLIYQLYSLSYSQCHLTASFAGKHGMIALNLSTHLHLLPLAENKDLCAEIIRQSSSANVTVAVALRELGSHQSGHEAHPLGARSYQYSHGIP